MISVMIVDDEKLVRQSIKNRVDWEKVGCTVIGEADNGSSALQFLDTHYVDVVVTDIKMPIMDGIEMIKQATKLYTNIQFIILSGFPDFQYAKTAMTLGVKNFIEKPIDIEELEKTLVEISHHRSLTYAELVEKSEEYCSCKNTQFMAVLQKHPKHHLLLSELQLEELFGVDRIYYFVDSHFPKCQFLLVGEKNLPPDLHRKFVDKVSLTLPKSEFYIFSVTDDTDDLVALHFRLVNSLKQKLFVGNTVQKPGFIEQKSRISAMKGCITGNKKTAFFSLFNEMTDNVKNVNSDIIELFLYEMCTEIRKKHDSIKMVPIIQEMSSPYFIAGFLSFDRMKTRICELFNMMFINAIETDKDDDIIVQICEHIKLNLDNELSLENISAQFFLSSSYLSSLFHKSVGTTIKHYIEDLRIEQAKSLLKNSSVSVNDVAGSVGYNDSNYFGKVFKKHTGMSPSQYQQKRE